MNTSTLLNNRYQIKQTLGRGGFGETFLAVDTHLPSGKQCVIKQLKPIIHQPNIPQWMCDRFEQEARILEYLGDENPQIPCLYAYFREQNNFYLVQEWIEGNNLKQLIETKGVFSEAEVEQFLLNILPVIQFIHSQKIIHRDIKPDNIIYRLRDNLPVLIDFGIVKEAVTTFANHQGTSAYSIAIGTPGYMAGEQAAGRPIYSSDLYGLGLTAIYLLTGKNPQSLSTDTRSGEILWRQELPHLHSNLAGVIDRAVRYNPRERFASAEEMLSALQPLTSMNSQAATVAVGGQNPLTNPTTTNSQPFTTNTESTIKPTVAVNSSIHNRNHFPENKTNWLITFFPLIALSLVAIGSFFIGYNILVNREPDLTVENPDSPIDNNLPHDKEIDREEDIESSLPEETIPPETQPKPDSDKEIPPSESIPETKPIPINPSPPSEIKPNPSPKPIRVAVVGTSATELMSQFGQPDQKGKGYWHNTTKWSYLSKFPNTKKVSYIVENSSTQVKEIQVSFSADTSFETILATFTQLAQGNVNPSIAEVLRAVTEGKTDLRSFNSGNLKGMIQEKNNTIYLKVWDNNFH